MRFRLRTRILLMIAGTFLVLASLTFGILATLLDREVQGIVRKDVAASERFLSYSLKKESGELQTGATLLARQQALKQYIFNDGSTQRSDYATVSDFGREWLTPLNADSIVITDQRGEVVGQTDSEAQPKANLKSIQGIATALEGESWSGVVLKKNHLMLGVSIPVMVYGYPKGTLTVYRSIDTPLTQELKNALGTEIAFVNQGKVMAASLSLPAKIPTPQGTPLSVSLQKESYLALYAPFPDTDTSAGIGFVTLRSYNQALLPYRRFQGVLMGLLGLALVAALAMGLWVARSVTQPLDSVVDAAQTLSRGDFPSPLEVNRADEIGLLQGVFNNMTIALRESKEQLLSLIDTDLLTGLDNHRRFQERVEQEATRCRTSGETLSLLLFDLDHFQEYNRQHGHGQGDEALKKIAILLRTYLPEMAILARYGGEEFVALLPQKSLEEAEAEAEQIRNRVLSTFEEEGVPTLSVSVGCATLEKNPEHGEGVVLAAELAVVRAKQLGRNRVCRFDSILGEGSADPLQLHRDLKDGSLATIQALAAAVDAKDTYTQGHSQRVAKYAKALALKMGLPKAEVELVFTTGTLHDVGKIGVPDGILNKPGWLEDEERAIMETHPVLGEVIVRKVPQLIATLPGVRHHHERWDGKGYPDKLAGEAIPRLARILALADSFDAMTSDRPYRKGLPVGVAYKEIEKGAGTQFDPTLTPIFLAWIEETYSEQDRAVS